MPSWIGAAPPTRGGAGSNPAGRTTRIAAAKWTGPSPPKAGTRVRIPPAARMFWSRMHLVRQRRCLRREVGFDSPRDRKAPCVSSLGRAAALMHIGASGGLVRFQAAGTDGRVAQRQRSRLISGRRRFDPSRVHARAPGPTGRGSLLQTGTVGVRISGRARSPDAREDERSFSKREAAGSNPAGASKRTKQLGYRKTSRRVHSSALRQGIPTSRGRRLRPGVLQVQIPVPGRNHPERVRLPLSIGEVAGSSPPPGDSP